MTSSRRSGPVSRLRSGLRPAVALCAAVGLLLTGSTSAAGAVAPPDAWTSEYAGPGSSSSNLGERTITAARAGKVAPAWHVDALASGNGFHVGGMTAPSIANGVVLQTYGTGSVTEPSRLVAMSARSGARLWSVSIPPNAPGVGRSFDRGSSILGDLVLIPYDGWNQPAGVVAVSIAKRAVVWSKPVPASPTGADTSAAVQLVADAGRAYLLGGDGAVTAFRTSDGARLWQKRPETSFSGLAVAGGTLFTTSNLDGLTAYDAATGVKRWSAPEGFSGPVVAGGRVITSTRGGVAAWNAAGCGKATCAPLWSTPFAGAAETAVGGADGSTVFATADIHGATGTTGRISRLSAATGRVQWSVTNLRQSPGRPVRVADTVWIVSYGDTLLGWSTAATRSTPLRRIAEPAYAHGVVQGIAAANGSLVVQTWPHHIIGYRVPGT